ncbi:MAG: carboxypeptidase-like regulatory domain-containing protein [Saprospiraceae bacterium]
MNYLTQVILAATFLLTLLSIPLLAQQTLSGAVTDHLGAPITGGTITVLQEKTFVTGTATDFQGNYNISLDPGIYHVKFSYVGYKSQLNEAVELNAQEQIKIDFKFPNIKVEMRPVQKKCFLHTDLYDPGETTQGLILHSREIRRLSKPN